MTRRLSVVCVFGRNLARVPSQIAKLGEWYIFDTAQAVTKQSPNGCVPSHALASANSQSVYPADRHLADFISPLPKKSSSLASRGNTCIGFGVMKASRMTILTATIGWLMTPSFHALHLAFLAIGEQEKNSSKNSRWRYQDTGRANLPDRQSVLVCGSCCHVQLKLVSRVQRTTSRLNRV